MTRLPTYHLKTAVVPQEENAIGKCRPWQDFHGVQIEIPETIFHWQ